MKVWSLTNLTQISFQYYIDTIDQTYVKVVLPRHEHVNFIRRKRIPTQNVLVVWDFNLCFTFLHAGTIENMHDAWILARAIHSPEIHFPLIALCKYYLVDSRFPHQPGCMALDKGLGILHHFQQLRDERTGQHRRFQDARERFNFKHLSYRNVIERAFGMWKQRWKILERMPSYPFTTQVAVVIMTIGIHNLLRRSRVLHETFL